MVRRIPTLLKSILTAALLTLIGLSVSSQITYSQTLAYVANLGSSTVSVINTASNSVVATVNVEANRMGLRSRRMKRARMWRTAAARCGCWPPRVILC